MRNKKGRRKEREEGNRLQLCEAGKKGNRHFMRNKEGRRKKERGRQ